MSGIDHILLYCLVFRLAFLYEKQCKSSFKSVISIKDYNYYITLILLVFMFVITEGLRYGRGVDQIGNYGPFYLHCMKPDSWFQEFEMLFVWINQIVYRIDILRDSLPFGSIFMIYALLFIISLLIYYNDKEKDTKYFLILAILATNYLTEWTIRQGVSSSFILIGLYYLEQKKWLKMVLFMSLGFCIHHGNIVAIFLLIFFFCFFNNRVLSWKVTVPIFVIMEYTMQINSFQEIMNSISIYLDLSFLGGNYDHYLDENMISSEANMAEDWKRSALTQFITVAFYSSILIIGAEICKTKQNITYIFNAFVIGILIFEPFRLAGSISRVFCVLISLWFIPVSYALNDYYSMKKSNIIVNLAFYGFFFYLFSYYGRYIFFNPEANYVWNQ